MSGKRITCDWKSILALSLALLAASALLAAGCGSSEEKLTINEVRLEKSDLPGWSLKEEVVATPKNADPKSIVKQLYDAGAVTILNQVFEKDGIKLQVNYVEMDDTMAGRQAEAMLEAAVGGTNYIGHKRNIAIEIIGLTPAISMAAKELGLSL